MSEKKKYQISKHNQKCIGPCYEPDTWFLHPILLDYTKHKDEAVCPTNEWSYTDPKTEKSSNIYMDMCMNPVNKEELKKIKSDIETDILIPRLEFNCKNFLKLYYKIYSFENTKEWINNNKSSPLFTKLRIMDCAIKLWGNQDDFIIDTELIDFYINVIKKNWIKYVYKKTKSYIHVDSNNKIFFKNSDNDEKFKIEKINFLINKFVDHNTVYKIFIRYLNKFKKDWYDIESHNDNLKKYFTEYIIEKIKEVI